MPGHAHANEVNFKPLSDNFGFGLIDHGWGPEGIGLPHCSESGHQRCGNRFSWHNQIRLRCPDGRDGPHAFPLINHITAFSSRQQMASAKRVPTFCLRSFPPAPSRPVTSANLAIAVPSFDHEFASSRIYFRFSITINIFARAWYARVMSEYGAVTVRA